MTPSPVDVHFPVSQPHAMMEAGHDNKSTPRGAGTPMRGASPTEIGHDRLMDKVQPPADAAPDRAAALVDGCPECVLNTEPPKAIITATNGYLASYLCTDCGHAWMTSWSAA